MEGEPLAVLDDAPEEERTLNTVLALTCDGDSDTRILAFAPSDKR